MSPTLSICIPTLNRCEFLREAVKSIFDAKCDLSKLELCISNNASDRDYSAIEMLLATAPKALAVRYVVQQERLPVDEHMLAVKNLAASPYIYFLGDDDFFLSGQLQLLLELVEREAPDLAIFNGNLVDGQGKVLGSHFDLPAQRYGSISTAFNDLRDKGMFGAVLVKALYLDDTYFRRLFGTAHGYGCYWFSLFAAHLRQQSVIVMIPNFPLVALRMAEKTYCQLEVYYRDIPYEIAVYQRYLPAGMPQKLNEQFKIRYQGKISSCMFLTQLCNSGSEIKDIRDINPGFYRQHRLKIAICEFLARSGTYELLRRIYRSFIKRKQLSQ
ncbi:glycosyltransferase (plasmid) [Chromobacterium amazonense]|uniref:glycosyltransferase n=1 Tax=Chromobacterium amazonense TaxID=1382803 RepID=UPI00237DE582|nr:glycosyltransferase [Chromobacterium amazonense]MDE1713186.1 glycosyltransferase [Chromobacterium amazonense]